MTLLVIKGKNIFILKINEYSSWLANQKKGFTLFGLPVDKGMSKMITNKGKLAEGVILLLQGEIL